MYKSIVALVLCIASLSGFSQVRIRFSDKITGEDIEGVAVLMKDSQQVFGVSDSYGIVETNPDKFPVTLVTSHISYSQHEFEITQAGEVSIELEQSVSILDDVIVTGQYEPTSIRNSVYKVRVLNEDRIKTQGTAKLQDVLSTELNIRFQQDPALGVSTISMQGLPGQNVKVLVDGVPMVGRQATTNAVDLNQININTIERVEIVEGPMSTIYGADALAGVINIITKKPEQEKLSGSVKLHEESVGDEYSFFEEGLHQQNINLGYQWNSWYASADLAHTNNGGWVGDATGREKQWNPKTQWLAGSTVGIRKNTWDVFYRLDYLNENIYNPAEYSGNEALDQHYITNRFMHQLQGKAQLGEKWDFNGILSYTDYSRKTQTTTVDKTTGEETLALGAGQQDVTSYNGATIRGTFQYKISNKLSLQPGYDVNLETGSGGRLKEGTNSISDYALFLSAEIKPVSFMSIRPGIRVVRNSVYQAPPVIPSINTKFEISSRHDIRLSYGRGFRAPSLRELYFDFFDSNHSIVGNPNLEAELSHSINASWNWYAVKDASLSYTSTVNGFYNSIDNMINYATEGTITTLINIDKYKSQGFTWTNSLQTNSLNLSAGFGYTGRYNQYSSADSELPHFTWSPELNASASYTFQYAGLTTSLYYKFTGQTPFYEPDPANDPPVHLAKAGSYHWADFTIQKTFLKRFSTSLGVRNLFDVTQVRSTALQTGTHSSAGSSLVGCGRSFFMTLTFNL
ncbi:MAG TPA: TonB-dependent receptor [Cyclobacteriaceae bacterium]|nr:TonB-dependent receptor [Cyclobacteriaceae bacterium]